MNINIGDKIYIPRRDELCDFSKPKIEIYYSIEIYEIKEIRIRKDYMRFIAESVNLKQKDFTLDDLYNKKFYLTEEEAQSEIKKLQKEDSKTPALDNPFFGLKITQITVS